MGVGVPHPVLDQRGTPSSLGWGGVPHPVLDQGGTPSQLDGVPPYWTRVGVPLSVGWGTPPIWNWDGVPPCQLDGVPPSAEPEMGYPPSAGWGTPSPGPGMEYPPQPMVNRKTFPSINITFPRTTYAGGNKILLLSDLTGLSDWPVVKNSIMYETKEKNLHMLMCVCPSRMQFNSYKYSSLEKKIKWQTLWKSVF